VTRIAHSGHSAGVGDSLEEYSKHIGYRGRNRNGALRNLSGVEPLGCHYSVAMRRKRQARFGVRIRVLRRVHARRADGRTLRRPKALSAGSLFGTVSVGGPV
jgi:hypothetical protein